MLRTASGASSRMRGDEKVLELVDGTALLRLQARRALFTGAHVAVTLPDYDHPRAQALAGLPVQLTAVPDAESGLSASLRRGVAMLPRGMRAVMIVPADMPELTTQDLVCVIEAFRSVPFNTVQQGCAEDGTPGHPVLFPSDCFTALQTLTGDHGARSVIKANAHRLRQVPLPGRHALTDLDTPEDWARWRAATGMAMTAAE